MNDWTAIAEQLASNDAGWYPPEAFDAMMRQADRHTAAELDGHVDYYERAATDISQALEFVEETGSEAAVALRATQRTMSSVASALRRRAAELRGEVPASRLLPEGIMPVPTEEE